LQSKTPLKFYSHTTTFLLCSIFVKSRIANDIPQNEDINYLLTYAKVCILEPNGNPNGNGIGSDAASGLKELITNLLFVPNSRNCKTPVRNEV